MLSEWGDRQFFFAKKVEYVASFDLALRGRVSMAGDRSEMVRTDELDGRPAAGTFYHVLGDPSVPIGPLDRDCPTGSISFVQERYSLRSQDGFLEIEGRLTLNTQDDAVISATYRGIARFFPPLTSVTVAKPRAGRAFINMGFETGDQRYRWLQEKRLVSFGDLTFLPGAAHHALAGDDRVESCSWASYDIYAGS